MSMNLSIFDEISNFSTAFHKKSQIRNIMKIESAVLELFHVYRQILKKSKAVPLHAMEAHGGEEVLLLLILNLGTRWGVSGQRHAPAALYPRGKKTLYTLDRSLCVPQSRSGRRG
jgi:hypothetical protein